MAFSVLLLTAACSQGSDSKSSSSNAIKVLTIAPTGTPTLNFDTAKVIDAYAKKVNDAGGVNGHKLQVISCNDKNDPNTAAGCARQAVAEKVVAVVGGFTTSGAQVMPVLEQAKIPFIGVSALSAQELSSPYSYPIQAGPVGFVALGVEASTTCTTVATATYDIPAAAALRQFVAAGLGKHVSKLGREVKIPPTTTDFSTVAKAIGASDCAVVALPSQAVAPLVASMQALGVKTRLLAPAGALEPEVVQKYKAVLNGAFTISTFPGASDAAWADAKKAAGDQATLSPIYENSWVSMLVLDKVIRAINGTVDAASVKTGLDAVSNLDTGGLTAPLIFTKGLPIPGLSRVFNPTVVDFDVKDGQLAQRGTFVDLGAPLTGK